MALTSRQRPGRAVPSFGVGLRPTHYPWILGNGPAVDWFEVVSENYLGVGGKPRNFLARVRERYPVAMHGVGLGIGNAAPPPLRYLRQLAELAGWLQPRFVSDHLCWTGHRGESSHDLLPMAYTMETLAHVAARVDMVQDALGRRFYLENPSAYVAFAASEMDEAEFLAELCRRTGCGLLLDVNNLYVNAENLGIDPAAYMAKLNPSWLCYMHLAGHSVAATLRIDTHDEPVPAAVWALYEQAVRRFPEAGTLVEWDDRLPEFPRLLAEVETAKAHHRAAVAAGPLAAAEASARPLAEPAPQRRPWRDVQDRFFLLATAGAAVADDAADLDLFRAGLPAPRLDGINVYADAYLLRISEVVSGMFPALTNVLGNEEFNAMIRAYLKVYPSTEISIKYAAAHLPAYLETWPLAGECGVAAEVLADLAALEWASEDLFDAPDSPPPVAPAALAEIAAADWEEVRFAFIHALRIVATRYDVSPVLAAVAAAQPPERPIARPTHYVVYRVGLDVEHLELPPAEACVLAALRAGATFGEACAAAEARGMSDEEAIAAAVQTLGRATALGLIHAVLSPSAVQAEVRPGARPAGRQGDAEMEQR